MGMQSGGDSEMSRLYVPFLHDRGIISEPTFSFYLDDEYGNSHVDVG